MVRDLTLDEQKTLFKIGYSVTIKPDANKYQVLYMVSGMYEQLGQTGKIIDISSYSDRNQSIYKPTDLVLLVQVGNGDLSRMYWWHYKSLISSITLKPTYEPKHKSIRTLESTKRYPYRFKTEEEFVKEFGSNWRKKVNNGWVISGRMDNLFGEDYPYDVKKGDILKSHNIWYISWDMLTPNNPSYTTKGKPIRQ